MLEIQIGEDGLFICNNCGRHYTQLEADNARGNHFLCSKLCVILHEQRGE